MWSYTYTTILPQKIGTFVPNILIVRLKKYLLSYYHLYFNIIKLEQKNKSGKTKNIIMYEIQADGTVKEIGNFQ